MKANICAKFFFFISWVESYSSFGDIPIYTVNQTQILRFTSRFGILAVFNIQPHVIREY